MAKYAEHMGMSKSGLGNKAKRQSWSASDLIKLSDLTHTHLAFVDNKTGKELISFDADDLKQEAQ